MCGFLTVLDRAGHRMLHHKALLDQIQHRGPDAEGLAWFDLTGARLSEIKQPQPHLTLGHRRLGILDLDPRSNQPFSSADGRYSLVYNGEIYNYIELRQTLQTEGCKFSTQGDSEVVLQALVHWGPEKSLSQFQGMFAFSLFDCKSKILITARDQLGVKPLFVTRWADGLAYASEVWPLLSLPGVSRKPNSAKLAQYITSGGQEHDGTSYFEGIQRVPAGTYEILHIQEQSVPERKKFWSLDLSKDQVPEKDATHVFREAFLKNVRLHLRSDVSWGVALSGGLDSSALVAAIHHLEPDLDLHTFSFLPNDPLWSEERWIDICNEHVGARAYKITPANDDLIDDLPALLRAQGEPFGTTSIYAQFRVMKLAAESGFKVMLDGQGADELLGGYAPYLSARVLSLLKAGKLNRARRLFQAAPNWAASTTKAVSVDLAKYMMPRSMMRQIRRTASGRAPYDWIMPELLQEAQIYAPGASAGGPPESYLKHTLLEATTHYGLPELLRYEDRNSMHFSLESRVPFLTAEFAEMCTSLPESSLIDDNGRTKSVLRDALKGMIPDAISERRDKIGFRPDIAGMNKAIVRRFLEEVPTLNLPEDLDWSLIIQRLGQLKGDDFSQSWIWRVVNLAYWHDLVQQHPICSSELLGK